MKIFKLLFILLVSFQVCSCQKEKGAERENPVEVENEKVAELENELDRFRMQLANEREIGMRQRQEQAALVSRLTGLVETLSEAQATIPSEPEVKVSLVAAVNEEEMGTAKEDLDEEARRMSRLQAQGEELAELVTDSGDRFEDLVITRVTDIGVVFRHKGGIARVPFTDLPAAWRERFYYDEDRALLSLKHERLAQARYNRAADARIEEMNAKKAAEEAEKLTLEKIAQVVEQVQQKPPPPIIGDDRIRVYPPLIVGRNYHTNGRVYHPSVVRTPVVRTPVVRTPTGVVPTIRPSSRPSAIRPVSKPGLRPTPVKPSIQRPTLRPSSSRPVKPSTQRPVPSRPASPVRPRVIR